MGGSHRIDRIVSVNQPSWIPTFISVTPDEGPTAGGTNVTITGSNLDQVTDVAFGGVSLSPWAYFAGAIFGRTGAHAFGFVDIVFTYNLGTVTEEDGFLYYDWNCDTEIISVTFSGITECPTPWGAWPSDLNTSFTLTRISSGLWSTGNEGNEDEWIVKMSAGGNCAPSSNVLHAWVHDSVLGGIRAGFVGMWTGAATFPNSLDNYNAVVGDCGNWDGSDCVIANGKTTGYGGTVIMG